MCLPTTVTVCRHPAYMMMLMNEGRSEGGMERQGEGDILSIWNETIFFCNLVPEIYFSNNHF